MKDVGKNIQNLLNKASPYTSSPQVKPTPANTIDQKQIKYTKKLWERMEQMYGPRWIRNEGHAKTFDGNYTDRFIYWAQQTKNLTDDDWKRAFKTLNTRIAKNVQEFKNNFAPSCAEFLACAKKPVGTAAQNPFPPKQVPNAEQIEKSREVGEKTIERLKGLFD